MSLCRMTILSRKVVRGDEVRRAKQVGDVGGLVGPAQFC